jgi:hypothetical protein
MPHPLGRVVPPDFRHVQLFPMTAVLPASVDHVERQLPLPRWHWQHDQGREGACVGFGCSMMMSILNEDEARAEHRRPVTHRYDCRWLWHEARLHDEFPDNDDLGDDDQGTTVRAACEILRNEGHVLVSNGKDQPVSEQEGITTYRWATTVDQIRSSLAADTPVSIGVNWYSAFDRPQQRDGEWWLAEDGKEDLGPIRGGHCVCLYGASDQRQAFHLKNSWGRDYPLVWLPYATMERLLREQGEAALVTDR